MQKENYDDTIIVKVFEIAERIFVSIEDKKHGYKELQRIE